MAQLTPYQEKLGTVRTLITKRMPHLKNVIQRGIDPDRFAKIAITVIAKSDDLLDCSPQSLLACMMQSAQLGLDLDPALGLAYLVPFKGTATFVPGYKGLMELARRSQSVSRIVARAVYANDSFEYEFGTNDWIHHKPADGDRGELTHVYAVAHLAPPNVIDMQRRGKSTWEPSPATIEFVVLSKADVDKFRARSRAKSGPWFTDYDAMALKTAVRRLSTWLPKSPELQKAVRLDEQAEAGDAQDFTIDLEPETPTEPTKPALDTLTARLPAPQTSADDAQVRAAAERVSSAAPARVEREPGMEG